MLVPAETFAHIGFAISNRHRQGSVFIQEQRFKAHFGVTPGRCEQIWCLLQHHPHAKILIRNARPIHLMWTLLFLKLYNSDTVLSGMAGCDEKTFRKWKWTFVNAIASMRKKVVSSLFSVAITIESNKD